MGNVRPVPLADDFDRVLASLPPDWTHLDLDLRILDEDRYVEAASLMVEKAAALFDRGEPCGAEANLAKLLAADASWEAANAAVQTFGGYGFDAEYDVERKFRETCLYQAAPISTNLILSYVAEHMLGLPRSF